MATPEQAVVVGYDGSPDSERALGWAVVAAQRRERPLHLLIAGGTLERMTAERRQRHEEDLAGLADDAREQVGPHGTPALTVDVVEGGAAERLVAAGEVASLVVVGALGHGRMSGLLMGSVSQHVSRYAPCSVAVVRQQHSMRSRRVVVGVDGSKGSEPALRFAFEHASLESAPLTALYGWWATPMWSGDTMARLPGTWEEEITSAEHQLSEWLSPWLQRYPDVKVTPKAIPVHPTRVLADASDQASIVVVGSRGRGAFEGLLLGSVGQGVLHAAHCTVVIAR
jgi:nucleotide-binding universal stress UspA family protein